MNNREKVRRAFSPLAADPETVNAVMAAASARVIVVLGRKV